jgi:glucosamine 6-phosphate synthetase-like amidotransferase/phosphosugar isomerase protein
MKEILVKLLSSVLKATALSALVAGVAYFAHVSVLMAFTISFISQFIVSYLYNSYIEFQAAKVKKEQQLKELEILSRITFNISCAGCKQMNEVVINANTDNQFDCVHCGAKNSVYIATEAALVTTPVTTGF